MSRESSQQHRSLLVVAIGNTHVRGAVWAEGRLSGQVTIPTERVPAEPDATDPLARLIEEEGCDGVVVSSVVPAALEALAERFECHLDVTVAVVGRDIPLPMPLDVEHPERVGADRVCAAAAGYARVKQACVVADFGTAITVNAVSDDGVFLGGAILPGLGLGARALAEQTAGLPGIQVSRPATALGRTTEEALNAGLFFGARGAVRELTEALATSFGKWPKLIFTGGDAALVGEDCDYVDVVDPDLGLIGLELADRMHQDAKR